MSVQQSTPTTPLLIRGLSVVALFGIAGWLALDARRPERITAGSSGALLTVQARAELASVQRAMMSWLSDQVSRSRPGGSPHSAGGAGSCPVDFSMLPIIGHSALQALLVPTYIESVPEFDPWGNSYDYRLDQENLLTAIPVIALRSAGADSTFEGDTYSSGATTGPNDDLVAADGTFVRDFVQRDPVSRQTASGNDIRNIGTAWLSWLVDNISLTQAPGPAGIRAGSVDLTELQPVTYAELTAMLDPQNGGSFYYMRCIPQLDGWGHPYEFFLNDNLLAPNVLAIRSPGADGVFEGDVYGIEGFPADDFERDTVWANGFFVQFPEGDHDLIFSDTFETGDVWGTWSECVGDP